MLTWCRLRVLVSSNYIQRMKYTRSRNTRLALKNVPDEYPRITVPQKMVENLAKHNLRVAKEKALKERMQFTEDKCVIKCMRPEFNHYRGQTYKAFNPKQLASYGWKHRSCPKDYFTIVARGKNPAMVEEEKDTFENMKLDDCLQQYLEQEGLEHPTKIQSAMIPAMATRNHIACASEAGSGKTFAYLLPCMQAILKLKDKRSKETEGINTLNENEFINTFVESDETVSAYDNEKIIGADESEGINPADKMNRINTIDENDGINMEDEGEEINTANEEKGLKSGNSPSVIIILPTLELARQVKGLCDDMKEFTQIDSHILHKDSGTFRYLHKKEGCPMDILITTPNILETARRKKLVSFRELKTLVLDEADCLLDDSFKNIVTTIFHKSEIDTSIGVQVVLVSATFPREIDTVLGDYLSEASFTKITTDHLHKITPHVSHKFLKLKPLDHLESLLTILKNKKNSRYMIFCNANKTCFWLSRTLNEMGVDNAALTAFSEPQERLKVFKSFQEGEVNVLVCTDIASRGLDTTSVNHVVNFDFPLSISDYLHRAGRVGRVGSKNTGRVTSFVIHRWDVDLIWKIEVAVRQGKQIQNANASVKQGRNEYPNQPDDQLIYDF